MFLFAPSVLHKVPPVNRWENSGTFSGGKCTGLLNAVPKRAPPLHSLRRHPPDLLKMQSCFLKDFRLATSQLLLCRMHTDDTNWHVGALASVSTKIKYFCILESWVWVCEVVSYPWLHRCGQRASSHTEWSIWCCPWCWRRARSVARAHRALLLVSFILQVIIYTFIILSTQRSTANMYEIHLTNQYFLPFLKGGWVVVVTIWKVPNRGLR